MEYTIETAIRNALSEAARKKETGHLYKVSELSDDGEFEGHDWSKGDPETVYTLISLWSDDENNDGTWADQIEEALEKEYPEYF